MKCKEIQEQKEINLQLKNKRKQELKEKGITLIALVVTIIILLILAGVTLNMALSGDGLFSRARNVADKYKKAQEDETTLIDEITGVRRISTAEELQQLATEVNEGNTFNGWTIILMNDIDLSSVCSELSEKSWTPIGRKNYPFEGTFDGNNKKITNLWINENSSDDVEGNIGLFGYVVGGEIKNLRVIGKIDYNNPSTVVSIGGCIGVINYGKLDDVECNVKVKVSVETANIGGVIGWAGKCTLTNIKNIGDVESDDGGREKHPTVGGIVGNGTELNFLNCSNSGNITSGLYSRRSYWGRSVSETIIILIVFRIMKIVRIVVLFHLKLKSRKPRIG